MKRLFAVIRSRGPAWEPSRPLEGQPDWQGHAVFMNGLEAERFVVLGGPLEGTPEVLLIIRAEDEAEIRARLAADPWSASDLLRVDRAVPWTLRLGSLEDPKG
jgi:uncharacterized protein YciI